MPTYISLLNYTQQGIESIKDVPARDEAAKKVFQAFGADLKAIYHVLGRYDAVAILEGPDDETAATLAMLIGTQGNIRTETLRAFTEDEFRRLVTALP